MTTAPVDALASPSTPTTMSVDCERCRDIDFHKGTELNHGSVGSFPTARGLQRSSAGQRLATDVDCPSYFYPFTDPVTGEVMHMAGPRCKRNDCGPCASWKARSIELAMHLAQPQWLVTLGPIGCGLSKLSQQVSRYRQRLRRTTSSLLQDAYFVEPYRYSSGHHLHDYAWGADLTPELVAPAAISSGLADPAHVHVQRISHHANLGYGMKMIASPTYADDPQRFQDANNGRLVHASHGYWRGPANHPAEGGYQGSVRRARDGATMRLGNDALASDDAAIALVDQASR